MPLKKNTNTNSYQENFQQLKQIIEKMERNDIPLEELTDIFKQGQELLKLCEKQLKSVTDSLEQELNSKN